MPAKRLFRRLRLEQLQRREVLSVTFVDSGQVLGNVQLDAFGIHQTGGFGDFDGDGDKDAFVAQDPSSDDMLDRFWINEGTGAFTPGQAIATDDVVATNSVALDDLDGDGDLDVVARQYSLSEDVSKIRVYINDGRAGFVAGTVVEHDPPFRFVLEDIDGDGDTDLVGRATGTTTDSSIKPTSLPR